MVDDGTLRRCAEAINSLSLNTLLQKHCQCEITWAAVSAFAQVVEATSFSVAADRLGLSKSLVSRHLSALERSLSVKLPNRSARRLSLTEGGG